MKMLRLIRSVNPEGGGPIEGLKQSSAILNKLGHEITVASLDAPNEPYLADFPLPCEALGESASKYGKSEQFKIWMKENHQNFDVVLVHGLWQYHSLAAWQVLHKTDTPYFVFTHGMLDPWFKREYPLKHFKKWLYWLWAEYRVLLDAKAVLFTSEQEKLLSRESFWLYKCNEQVINYGTSLPNIDMSKATKAFLEKFPECQGKRSFLFLSRIHQKKGCDLLLKAFAQVCKDKPEYHLIMAGPDQVGLRSELESLAQQLGITDRITWTGMIKGDLKWGAYHTAEAFTLPSHQENFGIVVAEAMTCGTPVLISNKVNIWQEIQKDGAGLVENDDQDGANKLLSTWIEMKPEQQDKMSKAAVRSFNHRFEINNATQSLLSLLNEKIKK